MIDLNLNDTDTLFRKFMKDGVAVFPGERAPHASSNEGAVECQYAGGDFGSGALMKCDVAEMPGCGAFPHHPIVIEIHIVTSDQFRHRSREDHLFTCADM